jgi:hypothetical protein
MGGLILAFPSHGLFFSLFRLTIVFARFSGTPDEFCFIKHKLKYQLMYLFDITWVMGYVMVYVRRFF